MSGLVSFMAERAPDISVGSAPPGQARACALRSLSRGGGGGGGGRGWGGTRCLRDCRHAGCMTGTTNLSAQALVGDGQPRG